MVGYPSDKTSDLDNCFNFLCRTVWWEEVNPASPGENLEEHINTCEKEWRRLGYKDERTWPHLFPSTLAELHNKWYKMEEAIGETLFWQELKEIFI